MNRIKFSSQHLINFFLVLISSSVIITALQWPLKAALFPIVIGICVFLFSSAEFLLSLYESVGKKREAMDYQFSEGIDPVLAKRRTLIAFGWIIGFFFLILLFGFNIGIFLYLFLYIKIQSKEKWAISVFITVCVWLLFWVLFIWLLHTPMNKGLIFKLFKSIGIG